MARDQGRGEMIRIAPETPEWRSAATGVWRLTALPPYTRPLTLPTTQRRTRPFHVHQPTIALKSR
jgi:hypothetical protein